MTSLIEIYCQHKSSFFPLLFSYLQAQNMKIFAIFIPFILKNNSLRTAKSRIILVEQNS
jgi:hypothetical protein